ncbi:FeoC-like transcriptional regulator [Vibrio ulleungensis]|jgi:putative ferrous iron transport protein C|uniref:Iron transporter FeoC n=1 Tax=Vibrio ulleungensis TaxID=2807619 RepID=A0ABS2HHR1_9VIBR|nr:FeoC-like transcriptional regulator [Vibrio ulleungensis]MBM7036544.1 iron transporter FeoC [Vibrio ulleungensis]
MILDQLKACIEESGCVEQKTLAKRYSLSEDGVEVMLTPWIKRGKVVRKLTTNKLGQTVKVEYCKVDDQQIPMQTIV